MPGHYAIVMEYINGKNVYNRLTGDANNCLHSENLENWAATALEIAHGTDFLHSQVPPIILRDLKSANILVDNDYHCKVKSNVFLIRCYSM
jgi:serine/threonine protein kinase